MQKLRRTLYADDVGMVSRSSQGLETFMWIILTACAAFGVAVSEARTEVMCLRTTGGGRLSLAIHADKQTIEFVY